MSNSERESAAPPKPPDGYRYEWVIDDAWDMQVDGRKCRMKGCAETAVVRLWRFSYRRRSSYPWSYCANHLYGRKIEDGVVKQRIAVELGVGNAG